MFARLRKTAGLVSEREEIYRPRLSLMFSNIAISQKLPICPFDSGDILGYSGVDANLSANSPEVTAICKLMKFK